MLLSYSDPHTSIYLLLSVIFVLSLFMSMYYIHIGLIHKNFTKGYFKYTLKQLLTCTGIESLFTKKVNKVYKLSLTIMIHTSG